MLAKAFTAGCLLQASLIINIGAQNIFLIECGLRRNHHLLAAMLCFFWDVFLVSLSISLAGETFQKFPLLNIMLGFLGALFLAWYGFKNLRRESFSIKPSEEGGKSSKKEIFLKTVAFSLLNPIAIVDTLVIVGAYSARYSDPGERFIFGSGVSFYTLLWFFLLAFLASYFREYFLKPKVLRGFFVVSGLVMLFFSFDIMGSAVLEVLGLLL